MFTTEVQKYYKKPLENSRCHKFYIKQAACWESTNIMCHHNQFSHHGDLAPGFVHPWYIALVMCVELYSPVTRNDHM
jgi:hypothetical protein